MFKAVFALLLLLCATRPAAASHLYGADFFYEYLGGTQYKISLTIYGDCDGEIFPYLDGGVPIVHLLDGFTTTDTLKLRQDGPGVEVTPVCDRELNNTNCKSIFNPIQGVTRYIYSARCSVPYKSTNWLFRFNGLIAGNTGTGGHNAGRSNDLSNLATKGIVALTARLNNTIGQNSTPQFTTIPTPFYCINMAQQYNHGAVDVDQDSLAYFLVPGLLSSGGTVSYSSPYTATLPMNGATGSWSFSSTTGQLSFTPTLADKFLIVNEILEYRNGVFIGSSMREMTFVVLANCKATPSESKLDTSAASQSAVRFLNDEVIVCQTTKSARFSITPINKSGDSIVASVTGLPTGVTYRIYGNNTLRPQIELNWVNTGQPAGSYNFFVTYQDKTCPLMSVQTKAFTLRILPPNELTGPRIVSPTNCVHKALVQIGATSGLLPRTISIARNGTDIIRHRDTSGAPFTDSLAEGTYTVTIESDHLPCPTQETIVVKDSGRYPFRPRFEDRFHCLDDAMRPLSIGLDSGAKARWYLAGGSPLQQAPVPRTDQAGRSFYLVSQRFKVCESDRDTFWVWVTKRPVAAITGELLRCELDTGTYIFSGSIGVGPILEYNWTWDKPIYTKGEGPGPWRTAWSLHGKKRITLQVLENKCASGIDTMEVVVRPKPYGGFDLPAEACRLDSVLVRYNTAAAAGQEFDWDFSDAAKTIQGAAPFHVSWESPGLKTVTLTTTLDRCSDSRQQTIRINPTPDIRILNRPEPVCIGEKIYLEASGGLSYIWRPDDSIRRDGTGVYAQVLKPSRYTVIGRNEFYCWNRAYIDYTVVEPCCNFNYPNAFTPNGDGRNDRFSAVTHGHHLEYLLSVYNRWGQRVFIGHSPAESWDGTFGGKPCDAGTYYWQLNALCYTGYRESRSGDVLLIR